MSRPIKLVFTGNVGSGKTTAIATLSEMLVINTDVAVTNLTTQKEKMTIAVDYGELTLKNGEIVQLYGTSGQQRFDYLWKILVKGASGVVILINNAGVDPLGDMARYTVHFSDFIRAGTAVMGITHIDLTAEPTLQSYHDYLQEQNILLPMFPVDVRFRENSMTLIDALLTRSNI